MQSERGAVMQIHLLDVAGARELYATRMVRDFPPEELKPFAAVEELLSAGLYEPLTFAEDTGAVVAYAWQVVLPGAAGVLCPQAGSPAAGSGAPRRSPRPGSGTAAHRILSAGRGQGHGAGKPGVRGAVPDLAAALRGSAAGRRPQPGAAGPVPADDPPAVLSRQRNILRQLGPYYPRKGVDTQ